MTGTISAPLYLLRGLQLIGWRDMPHALDYLFADGVLREGRWWPLMLRKCWPQRITRRYGR